MTADPGWLSVKSFKKSFKKSVKSVKSFKKSFKKSVKSVKMK